MLPEHLKRAMKNSNSIFVKLSDSASVHITYMLNAMNY